MLQDKSFQTLSLSELASITGINKYRWSRYFNGHTLMTERTLKRAASRIGMRPEELLKQVDIRREKTLGERANKKGL